ncbi:hypothetical protein FOPE_10693 [Fonsecaea pedrosoi]|nr:hypothetical protein FOPE_10693 [Fonsecaea pedrosoi]
MAFARPEFPLRSAHDPYDADADHSPSRCTKRSGPGQTRTRLTQVKGRAKENDGGLAKTFRKLTLGHVSVMSNWRRPRSSRIHAQENKNWTLVSHRATRRKKQTRLAGRNCWKKPTERRRHLRKRADANAKPTEDSPDTAGDSSDSDRTPNLDGRPWSPGNPDTYAHFWPDGNNGFVEEQDDKEQFSPYDQGSVKLPSLPTLPPPGVDSHLRTGYHDRRSDRCEQPQQAMN